MKPEFHPAAETELSASVAWYEARAVSLGTQMYDEVTRSLQVLCERPQIGKPAGSLLRKYHLRRFPYTLWYRVGGDKLRIIAIAHNRRRPGYWSKRR